MKTINFLLSFAVAGIVTLAITSSPVQSIKANELTPKETISPDIDGYYKTALDSPTKRDTSRKKIRRP
jgi:hypothetical protein